METDIIERAKNGDLAAYCELMQMHHRTIEKFAYQCGVHPNDISDVTQEVFVKLFRFLHQFQQDRFTTWLYKITLNTTRDFYRIERREKNKHEKLEHQQYVPSNAEKVEKHILLFEEDRELHEAIQQLEDKYRHPIILFYFHELPYEQIAEICQIPLSSVKTRLYRAKAQLKKILTAKGGVEFGQ